MIKKDVKIALIKSFELKELGYSVNDIFIAFFNYLKNNDIDKAIKYANECASEVVKHRGVSLI